MERCKGTLISEDRQWWVYCLKDPRTDSVRYVGVTINLRKRLISHLNANGGLPKDFWIRELRAMHLAPIMETLETGVGSSEQAERKWIAHYREIGDGLTNVAPGGQGSLACRGRIVFSEEHKQRIAAWHLGRTLSAETKAKISAAKKAWKMPQSGIDKRSAAIRGRRQPPDVVAKRIAASQAAMVRMGITYADISAKAQRLGSKLSDAARTHMREAWERRSPEERRKMLMRAWDTRRAKASGTKGAGREVRVLESQDGRIA